MLAICLAYIAFIILRYILFIPSFFSTFIMKGCWILSNDFSPRKRWSCDFCLSSRSFINLCMLNHLCALQWNLFDHSVWSFWYAVEFSLSVFYWEVLIYVH
jgi:hypothetical protein